MHWSERCSTRMGRNTSLAHHGMFLRQRGSVDWNSLTQFGCKTSLQPMVCSHSHSVASCYPWTCSEEQAMKRDMLCFRCPGDRFVLLFNFFDGLFSCVFAETQHFHLMELLSHCQFFAGVSAMRSLLHKLVSPMSFMLRVLEMCAWSVLHLHPLRL